jgi:hypothetical protein
MAHLSLIISIGTLFFVYYTCAQQCDQSSDVARFNCYPENNPTQDKCEARKCCWRPPSHQSNLPGNHPDVTGDEGVPYCYYPKDFPSYEVTSNETTDFGQRIKIVRSQGTYMPHDILDLIVDLIYETEQRLRIRIYDSVYRRYEVPLQVPVVEKKADVTDYEVVVNQKPFAIVVTRKSTGVIL